MVFEELNLGLNWFKKGCFSPRLVQDLVQENDEVLKIEGLCLGLIDKISSRL